MNIENGWCHVFGRGLEKRDIFLSQPDKEHFLELLEELHERFRILVHAYVLMSNHYHCILQTPDANLSQGMQWFHGAYAAWFNARHSRVGPLFQGRYRAIPIENSGWAYALSHYLHLNPLQIAGLGLDRKGRLLESRGFRTPTRKQIAQRLQRLREYQWSSYMAYAGYCSMPRWLHTGDLLRRAHRAAAQRRKQYRKDIRLRLTKGVDEELFEKLSSSMAIGSSGFIDKIRAGASEDDLIGVTGKKALRRRVPCEEVIKAIEELKGEKWQEFVNKRGDWGRPLFFWAARRLCAMTLSEVGEVVGDMGFSAVSAAVKRFERRAKEDKKLAKLQERVFAMLNVEP